MSDEAVIGFGAVVLVDPRGWLLLQERDEHAPIDPDKWGLVGGHVEPGETYEETAYRELAEETGVRLASGLTLWTDEVRRYDDPPRAHRIQVWVGATTLTDGEIVVGEGRRIVFVDPARLGTLDLAESAAHFLRRFVVSSAYRRLVVRS